MIIRTDDMFPANAFREVTAPADRLDKAISFPFCWCQHKPGSKDSNILHGYYPAFSTRPNIGLLHHLEDDPDQN
jgi:hypothetical protein